MKEGLIVYLIAQQQLPEDYDLQDSCRQLGLRCDQVELVGASQGCFDIDEAWYNLQSRGCGRVNLLIAQWDQTISPVHPPVRLSG